MADGDDISIMWLPLSYALPFNELPRLTFEEFGGLHAVLLQRSQPPLYRFVPDDKRAVGRIWLTGLPRGVQPSFDHVPEFEKWAAVATVRGGASLMILGVSPEATTIIADGLLRMIELDGAGTWCGHA